MTGRAADVVIVGAGGAGIAAAIEAAERGLHVVVVEAHGAYGGAARLSGGGCCIAGSPLQDAGGITDSPALALEDWMRAGGPAADRAWARRYLEGSVSDVFRWAERNGVVWADVRQEEGNSVARWHHPRRGGPELMAALFGSAQRLPIEWRFSTRVDQILVEGARVAGVRVSADGGGIGEIAAAAVIVATGGFSNDPELLSTYLPPLPGGRYLRGGSALATGSGHRMLRELGASLVEMGSLVVYPVGTPNPRDPSGERGVSVIGISNIWVNAEGRRFHDESRRGMSGTPQLLRQPGATSWGIFDSRELDRIVLGGDPYYRAGYEPGVDDVSDRVREFVATSPFLKRADTIEELARAAGLPADRLVETIRRFNAAVSGGAARDPEFGRPLQGVRTIEHPPFFAVQYFPWVQKCLGGVRTDMACRVVRSDGSAVEGLYAAGEVAGMAGGHMNGHGALEGTMLGPSLFAGRVAAMAIASAPALSAPA